MRTFYFPRPALAQALLDELNAANPFKDSTNGLSLSCRC